MASDTKVALTQSEMDRIKERGRSMAIPHLCHVRRCMNEIPETEFLCQKHMGDLTPRNRARVRSVQSSDSWRFRDSSEWCAMVRAAIDSLEVVA